MRSAIFIGAAGITVIALVPCVLSGILGLSHLSFAGTSILITTGVILEVSDHIKVEKQNSSMHLL